eukprot:12895908-Prorocentrum_lima.AAC.1
MQDGPRSNTSVTKTMSNGYTEWEGGVIDLAVEPMDTLDKELKPFEGIPFPEPQGRDASRKGLEERY